MVLVVMTYGKYCCCEDGDDDGSNITMMVTMAMGLVVTVNIDQVLTSTSFPPISNVCPSLNLSSSPAL